MRSAACACALACALAAGACGGIRAPDLFIVKRSGPGSATLTLLVNEEGGVHCNRGPEGKLTDPAVLQARAIQEGLKGPASEHLSLPTGRESVFSYFVRDENGWVRFHDDSPRQPKVLRELQAFVLATEQNVCHLTP